MEWEIELLLAKLEELEETIKYSDTPSEYYEVLVSRRNMLLAESEALTNRLWCLK